MGGAEQWAVNKSVVMACQGDERVLVCQLFGTWSSLDMCFHYVSLPLRCRFELVRSFQIIIPVKGYALGKEHVDSCPV